MIDPNNTNFLFLNREGRWADFDVTNLALARDGTLALAPLPTIFGAARTIDSPPRDFGPAGIDVTPDGTICYSHPPTHRLFKIDPCGPPTSAVVCAGGKGTGSTRCRWPRGVMYHRRRGAIFVADRGNRRIQIFDPASMQLLEMWRDLPIRPTGFAQDAAGRVYVLAYRDRVECFDIRGQHVPAFWERVAKRHPGIRIVAIASAADLHEIYLLDTEFRLVVCTPDGQCRTTKSLPGLSDPSAIAVDEGAVYVGDNGHRRVIKFSLMGARIGEARGYDGAIAALCIGQSNQILINTGAAEPPVVLAPRGAFVAGGCMQGGPFRTPSAARRQWHRVRMMIGPRSPGAHVRLYTALKHRCDPPAHRDDPTPPADAAWQQHALDATEVLVKGWSDDASNSTPAAPPDLWVRVEFSTEGSESITLRQIRVDFDHHSYLPYVPAVFSRDQVPGVPEAHSADQAPSSPPPRELLLRLLSLLDGALNDVESAFTDVPAMFDATATTDGLLEWLAGWLAVDLTDIEDPSQRRAAIRSAYANYARRGTRAGLRDVIQSRLGLRVIIDEPIAQVSPWMLSDDAQQAAITSLLGWSTGLAAAEPQGAVAGTAVLDQSQLVRSEQFGVPLFTGAANRVVVNVYRGRGSSERALAGLRRLIEREKPAHVVAQINVIEPRLSIGYQARVGIDTIVGGPSRRPRRSPLGASGAFALFDDGVQRLGGGSASIGDNLRLGD